MSTSRVDNTGYNVNEPVLIEQIPFEISLETKEKIREGIYALYGGVVRWAVGEKKGQIVEHLKPASLNDSDYDEQIDVSEVNGAQKGRFVQNIKDHKLAVGLIGLGTTAAVGIGVWYFHRIHQYVKTFEASLNEYIEAIEHKNLTTDIIDSLMTSLEEMERHKRRKKKSFVEAIASLVRELNQYMIGLYEKNGIKPNNDIAKSDDSIINLKDYLVEQKSLLKKAE